jgi:hypothetical protein
MPAFLLTCAANPDVDFLLYADFAPPPALPPNVQLRPITLDELGSRADAALGMRIDLRSARKSCDLKPVYGLIFGNDLKGYDFWSPSDLDVVWGRIRHFLTDAILRGHDVVSSRAHKTAGHFTLFRNDARTNRLFEGIPDLQSAMENPRCQRTDENLLTFYLRDLLSRTPAGAWPRVYWQDDWTISAKYQRAMSDSETLLWQDGQTFDAHGRELMYLHFHKLKGAVGPLPFGYGDTPAAFRIGRAGFLV